MDDVTFPLRELVLREVGPPPEVWCEGAETVVALGGEQDVSTATTVAEALAGVNADGKGDVVVDLSRVLFMDGAIIGVLIGARNALRLQSRDLTIRAPSRFARRVLELCGLLGLIEPVLTIAAGASPHTAGGHRSRTPRSSRVAKKPPRVAKLMAIPAPVAPIAGIA